MNIVRSPLNGSEKVTLVKKYKKSDLVSEWMASFKINIEEELSSAEEILKYRCDESGLFFYLPLKVAGSGNLYKELSKKPWYYIPEKWEYSQALKYCTPRSRILEVGCGDGEFLRKASPVCFQGVGLEINPSINFNSGCNNIILKNQSLEDCAKSEEGSFDLVCAFQVLEHIAEPKIFIQDCVKSVKKGGIIIFGTPNAEGFLKRSHNLLDLPPHHMGGWSLSAYQYLQQLFPIRIEKVKYQPLASYHVNYFFETWRAYYVNKGSWRQRFYTGALGKNVKRLLTLGVRKLVSGEGMFVVYRKI